MKHVRLFEEFIAENQLEFDFDSKPKANREFNPDEVDRLTSLGMPMSKTFRFESQIFISLDYQSWFESASQYGVDEFVSQAQDLGFDFSYEYRQYQDEEIDEDEFFDAAEEEIRRAGDFNEPLSYQGVVEARDFEDDLVNDFNESTLEEYSDVPGVETIRAKGVTREGNFVVEVVAQSDLDIEAMKEELAGQYADGWGEGYEQRDHEVDDVTYYVHTWRDRGFEIKLVNP
jgi:hypothetical protein